MDTIAQHLSGWRGRVLVPQSVPGLVSQRLMVMSYMEGTPLMQLREKIEHLPQWQKDKVGGVGWWRGDCRCGCVYSFRGQVAWMQWWQHGHRGLQLGLAWIPPGLFVPAFCLVNCKATDPCQPPAHHHLLRASAVVRDGKEYPTMPPAVQPLAVDATLSCLFACRLPAASCRSCRRPTAA